MTEIASDTMYDVIQRTPLEEIYVQFIPSHLTKGLIAGGISAAASLAAMAFGAYALKELKQVKAEEILALLGKY